MLFFDILQNKLLHKVAMCFKYTMITVLPQKTGYVIFKNQMKVSRHFELHNLITFKHQQHSEACSLFDDVI